MFDWVLLYSWRPTYEDQSTIGINPVVYIWNTSLNPLAWCNKCFKIGMWLKSLLSTWQIMWKLHRTWCRDTSGRHSRTGIFSDKSVIFLYCYACQILKIKYQGEHPTAQYKAVISKRRQASWTKPHIKIIPGDVIVNWMNDNVQLYNKIFMLFVIWKQELM